MEDILPSEWWGISAALQFSNGRTLRSISIHKPDVWTWLFCRSFWVHTTPKYSTVYLYIQYVHCIHVYIHTHINKYVVYSVLFRVNWSCFWSEDIRNQALQFRNRVKTTHVSIALPHTIDLCNQNEEDLWHHLWQILVCCRGNILSNVGSTIVNPPLNLFIYFFFF